MGGYNSGGGRGAAKVGYFLDFDLASLKRMGLDRPGKHGTLTWSRGGEETGSIGFAMFSDTCRLNYRNRPYGGEWRSMIENITIDRTQAGFGGARRWFLCPHCNRRCRVLYGGARFLCRVCREAVYESQYDATFHACHERARRIKRRLGDSKGDMWSSVPDKPKGMHWKTYNRLCHEAHMEVLTLERAMAGYMIKRGWTEFL
jgi:hypothetical protein